ncbi:MAG TPA: DUF2330 domain-containing protein [Candidatus Saccharimonadales bacterium]|nr:DUF2330 domain-containing protein [Candidatus Saccharimonadales bacterium]
MRRLAAASLVAASLLLVAEAPTLACGGLIGPNGAVNLLRTTTLAAYHNGVEHYVTAFQFAGGGGAFGSITPLPGVPTSVVRGGDWTLQRLIRETNPPTPGLFEAAGAVRDSAQVLLQVRIDALDITILRGGGAQVGLWAKQHGFRLPPDAPEVLDFYASRSPIFMAASFDAAAAAARGQAVGDGTPVHITIPTDNPWVPLRILALGKRASETVQADVYLLTDRKPAMLPDPSGLLAVRGFRLTHSAPATSSLLADLRSDKGMGWVPQRAWLTKIEIDAKASDLRFDLAIDASGAGQPSLRDAGFAPFGPMKAPASPLPLTVVLLAGVALLFGAMGWVASVARGGGGRPLAGA